MSNKEEEWEGIGLPFKVECPEALRNVYEGGVTQSFSLDEIYEEEDDR